MSGIWTRMTSNHLQRIISVNMITHNDMQTINIITFICIITPNVVLLPYICLHKAPHCLDDGFTNPLQKILIIRLLRLLRPLSINNYFIV